MKSRPEIDKASTAPTVKALSVKNQVQKGINMSNSTEVTTNRATTTPDLTIVDGQITTTSQEVAHHFCKRHGDVLRAIRNLEGEVDSNFYQRNFASVMIEFINGKGGAQKSPACRITRDGFTLLAMGFTGKEAMHWKLAYIDAFNKMEAQLLAQSAKAQPVQATLDYDRISPAQAQDLKQIVQAIVDAGIQNYAETWARLQRKFKVHSYLALHPGQYESARAYLIAKLPDGYTEAGVDAVMLETAQESISRLARQLETSNDETAADFMPLVQAVLRKQGFDPAELLTERRGVLPADQVKEITDRLYRLGQLFNPLSTQFADVLGIRRILLGLHPDLGMQQNGYRQVIPLLAA